MRSARSTDSAARRILTRIASAALYGVLGAIALGAVPSDSARSAATTPRIFDPTLICGRQTAAALPTRVAKRVPRAAP